MTNKRKRPLQSLHDRLGEFARAVREAARRLPSGAGAARRDLLLKARDREAAAKIDRWLSSRELRGPSPPD
jgi:hypothetical protein